ncbi:BrnT family toxin [Arsukibacterium sp.]|uniref:BrnT family toxin n=1 Tax=Arsukibacterium sp. TaxID=1977258 RepID=UPI002FD9D517
MKIEYDTNKNTKNILERELSFDRAQDFHFETAKYLIDNRQNYGEIRIRALDHLDGHLHALVFVEIEDGIRVISFRKANKREVLDYEKAHRN